MTRGFTLIETVLYIGLMGILMTGTLLIVYQLLQSSSHTNAKTTLQNEGTFVLRKLDWAFSTNTNVWVRLTGTTIEMSTDGVTYVPLTTQNVSVSSFNRVTSIAVPRTLDASTTINGVVFTIARAIQ